MRRNVCATMAPEPLGEFLTCGRLRGGQSHYFSAHQPAPSTPMNVRSVLLALSTAAIVVACAASETKTSPPIEQSPTPRLDPVAVTAKPTTAAINPDSVKA